MPTQCYAAYGSNLHPIRISDRLPSAQFQGTAYLSAYRFQFNMTGADDSAKGNIMETGDPGDRIYVALYHIHESERSDLDRFEGPIYSVEPVQVTCVKTGEPIDAFLYIGRGDCLTTDLKPYDWYKAITLLGMRYQAFPEDYIAGVEAVDAIADPDEERKVRHESLILQMS
jgi:gamma-glutamylcyclotransferase